MPNQKHLKILLSGVDKWNAWRLNNSERSPELGKADFRGANLTRANLTEANLTRANFTRANFTAALLTRAYLRSADLSKTKLVSADLAGVNLTNAKLVGANLTGANLSSAKLNNANLNNANLTGVNFTDAVFSNTIFSGKHQLNTLAFSLTEEQMLGCVFEDESAEQDIPVEEDAPGLRFHFTRQSWRPVDAALVFMALEIAANRIQTLCRSDQSEEDLQKAMSSPSYPDERRGGFQLSSVRSGSLEFIVSLFRDVFSNANSPDAAALAVLTAVTLNFVAATRKNIHEGSYFKKKNKEHERDKEPVAPPPAIMGQAVPMDYQQDLPNLTTLWKNVSIPTSTLSKVNGHSQATNEALFKQGLSSPLALLHKQFRDGLDIEVTPENFDLSEHLDPEDRIFGPDAPDEPPSDDQD